MAANSWENLILTTMLFTLPTTNLGPDRNPLARNELQASG
jgi:hypothetical protein